MANKYVPIDMCNERMKSIDKVEKSIIDMDTKIDTIRNNHLPHLSEAIVSIQTDLARLKEDTANITKGIWGICIGVSVAIIVEIVRTLLTMR